MTVTAVSNRDSFVSSGIATPRTIPFPFRAAADLIVTVDGAPRRLNVDYQIGGAYPTAQLVPLAGFAVAGARVQLRRRTPARQDYRISSTALKAAALETELDRSAMVQQDHAADLAEQATAIAVLQASARRATFDPGVNPTFTETHFAPGLDPVASALRFDPGEN